METAQLFPEEVAGVLTRELICYGRSVVRDEWERMRAATPGDRVNPWGVELFRTVESVEPETTSEQSAYDKWLEQSVSVRGHAAMVAFAKGPARTDRCSCRTATSRVSPPASVKEAMTGLSPMR